MPSFAPPKRATAYTTYVSLVDQANTKLFKAAPTIATGDWKVSQDGGALADLATLPTVVPAGGVLVKIDLSAAEMTADNVSVVGIDAAGAEWCNLTLNLATVTNQFDDAIAPDNAGILAAIAALSIPSAGDIATAVWAATERSLTTFGTLVADVWSAVTRTLTESGAGGATAAEVWSYSPRTLTSTANLTLATLAGGDLAIVCAVTFEATLTGLSFPAGWSRIFFTCKQALGTPDATAAAQIVVSNPGAAGDGLLYLNAQPATNAAWGSLVVSGDSLTITLADDASALLQQGTYEWDLKALIGASSTSVLLTAGSVSVSHTPTEAV